VSRSERLTLALVLLAAVALRTVQLDQPIVENYVGRQVPTAMVARNLERGGGFLRPRLDTGPFPNYFLVEPPVYQALVVGLRRLTGLALEPCGRLVSALGIALGAWGLFGMVRRREGPRAALLAAAVFVTLPITMRYGRAFQPDAPMLGAVLAGASLFDAGGRAARPAGLVLLAVGIAMKLTSAFVLLPLVGISTGGGRLRRALRLAPALVPAGLWYAHAWGVLASGGGSRATADAGRAWLEALGPLALLDPENAARLARFVLLRAFTPLAVPLAVLAALGARATRADGSADRFWAAWTLGAVAMLLAIAGKLHHEYYLLALAPPVAVGMARGLLVLGDRRGVLAAAGATIALGVLAGFGVRSTWSTPEDWRSLAEAARVTRRLVPGDALLVAPEALIYRADRRGCRLETGRSARRAAGEWGATIAPDNPIALVSLYRQRGARYFADLTDPPPDPARRALHDAVRARYAVRYDGPGVLIAALTDPGDPSDEPQGPRGDRPRLRPLEGRGPQDRRPDGL
jgi:4-amino-4-deoxy-L-arabinose transferase-like glycosyltransferase